MRGLSHWYREPAIRDAEGEAAARFWIGEQHGVRARPVGGHAHEAMRPSSGQANSPSSGPHQGKEAGETGPPVTQFPSFTRVYRTTSPLQKWNVSTTCSSRTSLKNSLGSRMRRC